MLEAQAKHRVGWVHTWGKMVTQGSGSAQAEENQGEGRIEYGLEERGLEKGHGARVPDNWLQTTPLT